MIHVAWTLIGNACLDLGLEIANRPKSRIVIGCDSLASSLIRSDQIKQDCCCGLFYGNEHTE